MRSLLLIVALAACSKDPCEGAECGTTKVAQALFVAREGELVSFDIATGEERPGTVQNVVTPVDLYAHQNGWLTVNLTNATETLIVDGTTMLEEARIRSSSGTGLRPVHSYLSPDGRYLLGLNDGMSGAQQENSAFFIDLAEAKMAGEVGLGVGHHKASFSSTTDRVVISNIGDCNDVLTVYDYSDIADIRALSTLTGEDAGFDAADPGEGSFNPRYCDGTYSRGLPPSPHGCATSKASEKAYCNLTSSGAMVVVDIDADPPTFSLLPTNGSGGGFTLMHPEGQYAYTMQESPREGEDGVAPCTIGQIAVTDTFRDRIVAEVPIRYRGPACTTALAGTPAESANLGHAFFTGTDRLFVPTSGGFMQADARVNQVVVLDTSIPAEPFQLESIEVGLHTSHSAGALSGDGKWLFVVNGIDGTVSQIDIAELRVVRTLDVGPSPRVIATFGTDEGPSDITGPIVGG